MNVDIDQLRPWIGRRSISADSLTPAPLLAFSALLDDEPSVPAPGDPLPPGAHWLYFLEPARQSELGPDGHPKRGGFLPPVPLPRRMWAGGRLEFARPLRIGEAVTRTSEIRDVTLKEGRTGAMIFVVVRHEVAGTDGVALVEEHDIVYREAPQPGAALPPPKPAPSFGLWRRTVRPDSVLLFRYSALTMNGHRIHYDHPYAVGTEGYRGLLVHGPLIATLLMDLCRREGGRALTHFEFRGLSPLIAGEPFTLSGTPKDDGAELWAAGPDGALAMSANARFAGPR